MYKMSNIETGIQDTKWCVSLTSLRSGWLNEALPRPYNATGSDAARADRRLGPHVASACSVLLPRTDLVLIWL